MKYAIVRDAKDLQRPRKMSHKLRAMMKRRAQKQNRKEGKRHV